MHGAKVAAGEFVNTFTFSEKETQGFRQSLPKKKKLFQFTTSILEVNDTIAFLYLSLN